MGKLGVKFIDLDGGWMEDRWTESGVLLYKERDYSGEDLVRTDIVC